MQDLLELIKIKPESSLYKSLVGLLSFYNLFIC